MIQIALRHNNFDVTYLKDKEIISPVVPTSLIGTHLKVWGNYRQKKVLEKGLLQEFSPKVLEDRF